MKLKALIDIMSCKEGYELFDKIVETLNGLNIDIHRKDGTIKDLYEICCEVAEAWNRKR